MKDSFGRTIDYLRISVTDRCCFRCIYCMGPEGVEKKTHGEILRFEEIREIAAMGAACGIRKLRLTGGEPLLRPELPTLCRMLKEIPGIQELTLTTNGALLADLAEPLKAAGTDRLNISLDSLRPDRFRRITRGGSQEAVLEGIRAAEQAGFQNTKLDVVLLGGINQDEIRDFADLTVEKPLEVRFIELMPMGVCGDFPQERFISGDLVLQTLPELQPLPREGVAERFRLSGAKGTLGLIRAVSHSFCGSCSRLRLTSDGKLKPCLHSGLEIPVRGLHGPELEAAFLQAVRMKPKEHSLRSGFSGAARNMYEIGG